MVKNIELVTLDEFVELVKPQKGIVIYNRGGGGITGNKFSLWEIITRDTSYLLNTMGIPTLHFNEKNAGNYKSPYQAIVENAQKDVAENPSKYFQERLKSYQEAKEKDEAFVKPILEEGKGLWVPGCFCCLGDKRVGEMTKHFEKGKIGILVPRDHCYLDLDRKDGFSRFGANESYIDHFVFVAPERKK